MSDGPKFRRDRAPAKGAPWSLVAVLIVVTVLLMVRALWPGPTSVPLLVEVAGGVPSPGTYALDEGTVHNAVTAAGGDPAGMVNAPVPHGHRVVVAGTTAVVERPSDPVLVTLPVDPNVAERHELMAIPGIGAATADRILADRAEHGPFRSYEALGRVKGLRNTTLAEIEPFVKMAEVPPMNLNTATAGELETLSGIGPVLAARIVVDRAEHGPYTSLDDLRRVHGVGERLLGTLGGHRLEIVAP